MGPFILQSTTVWNIKELTNSTIQIIMTIFKVLTMIIMKKPQLSLICSDLLRRNVANAIIGGGGGLQIQSMTNK